VAVATGGARVIERAIVERYAETPHGAAGRPCARIGEQTSLSA